MQTMSVLKKAMIVGVCVTPLVLGACGSNKEENKAEGSTSSASSVSAVAKQATSSSDASTSAATSSAAPTSEAPAPASEPAVPPEVNLDNPIQAQQLAPIEGQPASAGDKDAITNVVRSMVPTGTLRQFMATTVNNTCARVIEEGGGVPDLNEVPDLPLESIPDYQKAKPTVDSVEDVRVNGESASAAVTHTSNGKTETGVMRFQRENGAWKMCK